MLGLLIGTRAKLMGCWHDEAGSTSWLDEQVIATPTGDDVLWRVDNVS